jgi:hypothetical protein
VKLLLAMPEALNIPAAWLSQALTHYNLQPDEFVVTTLRGNLNKLIDEYCTFKIPRLMFSTDRIQEMMEYIDAAFFIWDGKDAAVNNLRNWAHAYRKPYTDWILPTP